MQYANVFNGNVFNWFFFKDMKGIMNICEHIRVCYMYVMHGCDMAKGFVSFQSNLQNMNKNGKKENINVMWHTSGIRLRTYKVKRIG